jgi:hypothetical protein
MFRRWVYEAGAVSSSHPRNLPTPEREKEHPMKLPAYLTITLSANDKAALADAHRAFVSSMRGLTEDQQLARAKVLAAGVRESDPYTRALARQMVDADKARTDVQRADAELERIKADLRTGGYRPREPQWRGAALLRQEELERERENAYARFVGIMEDTLETAQKKGAVHFREARARAETDKALGEAVARQEAKIEAEAIERQAEGIARARRMASGRSSGADGESR